MKILLLDIETSPNQAFVWGLWNQNVGLSQLIDSSETLCWSAKWYGTDEVIFDSINQSSRRRMVRRIHRLIDASDIVVHYNGSRFDLPTLNKEFLLHDLEPPAPIKQIDLLKVVRKQFRFPSNKLDYVAQALKLGNKNPTTFRLWVDCMRGDQEAWKTMQEYNIHDVLLLEKLYDRLKPWIKHPINHSVVNAALVCPNCGSQEYRKRGFAFTATCKYQRYQCKGCGSWFRATTSIAPKAGEKFAQL